MKRTLLAAATSLMLVASATAFAAPASAKSTGGYQICYSGKASVKVKGASGFVTVSAPGRTTTQYVPSGVIMFFTGTQQVGTWTVSGSYQTASAYCS